MCVPGALIYFSLHSIAFPSFRQPAAAPTGNGVAVALRPFVDGDFDRVDPLQRLRRGPLHQIAVRAARARHGPLRRERLLPVVPMSIHPGQPRAGDATATPDLVARAAEFA